MLRALLSYLAFWLAFPVLLAHQKLRRGYRQRLGWYRSNEAPAEAGPRVWMHGASAGDVLALMPTVRALKQRTDSVQVILSTTTNTGRTMAERFRNELASIVYQPYDIPGAVRRALKRLDPDVLVLEYTELWPQLIQNASRRGTRLVLHNGRFSSARLYRYRVLFRIAGPLLHRFDALLLRDDTAAECARLLGADPARIAVTGNTKFDNLVPDQDPRKLEDLRTAIALPDNSLVWVAGSTHDGEEELILESLRTLRRDFPHLRLLIAPRYIDRAARIEACARRLGMESRLRSTTAASDAPVVILDTMGELAVAYGLADVVFVGGSFVTRGGQNILEPAAQGKPVLFGPHMENFADSVTLLLGRGGIQVAHAQQLVRVLKDLLERPEHRQELGALARELVHSVSGAAERNAERITEFISRRDRDRSGQASVAPR